MKHRMSREWRICFIIFIISAIVRTVLGCYFPRTVNCYPDELRYLAAAESLWNNHAVEVFNLPSDFGKVGYSILIAPAFAIESLRLRTYVIALISALLMSLGIFAVYDLARRLLTNERLRLFALILYALSSTMTYSMTYVSEILFVPVMLFLLDFLYVLLVEEAHGKKRVFLIAGCVALWLLAYLTKEIALVVPAALLLYYLTRGIYRLAHGGVKNKKAIRKGILGGALVIVLCAGIYLASNFGTSFYQLNFDVSFYASRFSYLCFATGFYLVATLLAFCFIPALYPLLFYKNMERRAAEFTLLLWYILCVTAFVVSYTIYVYEDYPSLTPRAHVRYVEYLFVPFLIVCFHLIEQKEKWNTKLSRLPMAILAVIFAGSLLLFQGFNGKSIDHTMLFFIQVFSEDGYTFLPYKARLACGLVILAVVILTILFYNNSKAFFRLLLAGLLVVTLANNMLSCYVQYRTHTHDAAETADAEEVRAFVAAHDENVAILEPQEGHDELLDTFLVDCSNVMVINNADGLFYDITGGNLVGNQLLARWDIVAEPFYPKGMTPAYLLVDDDFYTIEETEALSVVTHYESLGYTLYELTDQTHYPLIRNAVQ